jgi:hypothetical protein
VVLLAQGGFRGPGRYEIYSPLSKKVIDMDSNDQRTIIQFESRRTDNQLWDITDAGGGFFYIRNARNGNALAVQNDRNSTPLIAEPYNGSANQQWRIESGDNSAAILVNRNGKAIDVPYGSTNNGSRVNSYNRNNEVNQQWQFNEVGSGPADGGLRRRDRYDSRPEPGRGGNSRYDAPIRGGAGRPDADGMYYDDRDQMYKIEGDGICIYRDRDFRGEAICARTRADRARVLARFGSIGSIKFFGRVEGVQLFDREDFRGNAVEITRDERDLSYVNNPALRNAPRSIRVY